MAKKRPNKIRTAFRRNYGSRTRQKDFTDLAETLAEEVTAGDETHADEALTPGERITGRLAAAKHRTIVSIEGDDTDGPRLAVDDKMVLAGRVLSIHGISHVVRADNGARYDCVVRKLLKTIASEDRHVVAVGDFVRFLPNGDTEGLIVRVEPRTTVLSRLVRNRRHVIVTNVDSILIVVSAFDPPLKPNLIDRYLVTAQQTGLDPLILINKIDLIEPTSIAPLVGVYAQMGYDAIPVSATAGWNIHRVRQRLVGRSNVIAGQSGVGKSSLLNRIDPSLNLRTGDVTPETRKGRHTTTSARLIPLADGGFVVDTPGIRTFQLWDVIPEEVAGHFRDIRPFLAGCRFPDCTHRHEDDCAVKDAVADGLLDARRYDSYVTLFEGQAESEDGF